MEFVRSHVTHTHTRTIYSFSLLVFSVLCWSMGFGEFVGKRPVDRPRPPYRSIALWSRLARSRSFARKICLSARFSNVAYAFLPSSSSSSSFLPSFLLSNFERPRLATSSRGSLPRAAPTDLDDLVFPRRETLPRYRPTVRSLLD